MGAICQHCKIRRISRSRRLCFKCFHDESVRDLYPVAYRSDPPRAVCWACGCECAKYHHLPQLGWQLRYIHLPGGTTSEVYCPSCFKTWGWPDWSKAVDIWEDKEDESPVFGARGREANHEARIACYMERAERRLPLFAKMGVKEAA